MYKGIFCEDVNDVRTLKIGQYLNLSIKMRRKPAFIF